MTQFQLDFTKSVFPKGPGEVLEMRKANGLKREMQNSSENIQKLSSEDLQ